VCNFARKARPRLQQRKHVELIFYQRLRMCKLGKKRLPRMSQCIDVHIYKLCDDDDAVKQFCMNPGNETVPCDEYVRACIRACVRCRPRATDRQTDHRLHDVGNGQILLAARHLPSGKATCRVVEVYRSRIGMSHFARGELPVISRPRLFRYGKQLVGAGRRRSG
jgi:hypothetical protein